MPATPTFFFVLNGLLNGEEGVLAQTAGFGAQMRDGWYFIFDGEDDGHGPYHSRDSAERAVECVRLTR